MARQDRQRAVGWRDETPVYINFPISMFRKLDGDSLDVKDFKKLVDAIIDFGIASRYINECGVNHSSRYYYEDVFTRVLERMGITVNGEKWIYFSNHVSSKVKQAKKTDGEVFCGMNKTLLFHYLNEDVSDFECVQFLCYCAIRSILGSAWIDHQRPVIKRITWEFILSRMAGNTKREPVEKLPKFVRHYSSKRHRSKLRKAMTNKWPVQIDGRQRGRGGAFYMIGDSMPIAEAVAAYLERRSRSEAVKKAQKHG